MILYKTANAMEDAVPSFINSSLYRDQQSLGLGPHYSLQRTTVHTLVAWAWLGSGRVASWT